MNYEKFQHKDKNIFLVDMTKELNPYFSEIVQMSIEKHLAEGKKIGILVNKKGYASGIICQKCGHIPQCKKCSVSISYHKISSGETIGLCHICKTQYNVPTSCPNCRSEKIKDFGLGTQKVAEFLKKEFKTDALIIESETVNSPNKITRLLDQIQTKHSTSEASMLREAHNAASTLPVSKIIIGTSLLCSPIQNYNFDLIIFLNADFGLNIPDYTSAEKNFYFLYETFMKHQTKHFIVQSFNPDHYSIRNACKLDKEGFYEVDNKFRQENNYPPFAELCVILYKNDIEETMFTKVDTLHKELLYLKEKYIVRPNEDTKFLESFRKVELMPPILDASISNEMQKLETSKTERRGLTDIEIFSTPPLIYKMFGKYRYNVILKGKQVKEFMDIVYPKLNLAKKGFKVDWMAESIV